MHHRGESSTERELLRYEEDLPQVFITSVCEESYPSSRKETPKRNRKTVLEGHTGKITVPIPLTGKPGALGRLLKSIFPRN